MKMNTNQLVLLLERKGRNPQEEKEVGEKQENGERRRGKQQRERNPVKRELEKDNFIIY